MHAKPHHESKLESAAATVAEWRAKIRTLNDNIAKAEAAAAASIRARQENVLAASLGDDAAKINLAEVLEDDRKATRDLEDLRLALPLAEQELRTAEHAHRVAEADFRKAQVDHLARQRVTAAAAIDKALADFSTAWADYESIGRELFNASVDRTDQIYLAEHFDGLLRLAASLPHEPFYSIRWRHSFAPLGTGAPLAVSEAAFWRVPPVETVKAA